MCRAKIPGRNWVKRLVRALELLQPQFALVANQRHKLDAQLTRSLEDISISTALLEPLIEHIELRTVGVLSRAMDRAKVHFALLVLTQHAATCSLHKHLGMARRRQHLEAEELALARFRCPIDDDLTRRCALFLP